MHDRSLRAWLAWSSLRARLGELWASLRAYFVDEDPNFATAFVPALVLSALIFVRSPLSNYIFDEQEALLANPFVNGQAGPIWNAFKVDFWGLPPARSIGSYRPLPDLIWRALWYVSHEPFLHHCLNVVVHAVNAALLASLVLRWTGRRAAGWLAGGCFLTSAVLTEAVTGVVGIADVLAGLFVLLALHALARPLWLMPLAVFASCVLGLFSKESVLVAIPLLPWAALVSAPILHPRTPLRVLRAAASALVAVAALVLYTWVRKRFYPVAEGSSPVSALPADAGALARCFAAFLHWFQQPQLPHDAINNPLVNADFPHRLAGALRVYARGLGQVLVPWSLSGDYSFRQEPVPERLVFTGSVLGAALLVLPPLAAIAAWIRALVRECAARDQGLPIDPNRGGPELGTLALLALGLLWVPIAYFPHSNIPVLLPTVRAERFWYLPVIGSSCLLALLFERARSGWAIRVAAAFFAVQVIRARAHAFDYTDDLIFWRSTRDAAPLSAKAQLNYSVMLGARGRLPERLKINAEAMRLAPDWPMAFVYYGDTLCRMHRAEEAFRYYVQGFEKNPADLNLIALGLQCLWDEKAVSAHKDELLDLGEKYPGSWLAFLTSDVVYNGEANGGVQKKYRPRSYDEGPKER